MVVMFLLLRSSARMSTLLEQLQKLCLAGSEAKYEQEKTDVEQLRYVTNKIQQLLSSQGNSPMEILFVSNELINMNIIVNNCWGLTWIKKWQQQ